MTQSSLMDVIIAAAERSEKLPLYRVSDATRAELRMLDAPAPTSTEQQDAPGADGEKK